MTTKRNAEAANKDMVKTFRMLLARIYMAPVPQRDAESISLINAVLSKYE